MRNEIIPDEFRRAIDASLSGLREDPLMARRVIARLNGKDEVKVKKRLSTGLVLAIVIVLLMAAAALATVLLTHQEVVEQVAIPLAIGNDGRVGVNNSYSPEELAELVRELNENGITLEENSRIMQHLKNGQGYYEEEVIMEICRQAFGGNYYAWTLEEQDWYEELMVQCGWHESHLVRLPGPDNMTYEEAEAFAFERLRQAYGPDLEAENRDIYELSRQFYLVDDGEDAVWSFTLDPKDVMHGQYTVQFLDRDPEHNFHVSANIPDWSKSYTAGEVLGQFHYAYGWDQGKWSQSVWRQLHEMMQDAVLEPDNAYYTTCRGYLLTDYPDPAENDITRDEAIRVAREALKLDRAALDSAVLTEYEGHRAWLVGFVIYQDDQARDGEAGNYVITVDSVTGIAESICKKTVDDDTSFAFVPQAVCEKVWEGMLKNSDYILVAKEALGTAYPGLDMDAFTVSDWGGKNHNMHFTSTSITQGDASVTVTSTGSVLSVTADPAPLNGDNVFDRFRSVYGYFGGWSQDIWGRLEQEMEKLEPTGYENLPLKNTRYPQEDTVTIDRVKAQELAILASGKRTTQVNTCVLVEAQPHPVWIMRLLTDEADSPVMGINAETGEVVFIERYKVDYTPQYVLYSMPEIWRKIELEKLGTPYMAKMAITYRYGDMWLDDPELDVDNTANWECVQDGLTVRYIGRWAGIKSYEVELDARGFVLRCEETDSASTETRPQSGNLIPVPTPRPDGSPWFFDKDYFTPEFRERFSQAMETYGVTTDNIQKKVSEWENTYGECINWPQECYLLEFFMTATDDWVLEGTYPIFCDESKPSRVEILNLAVEAFHQTADDQMDADWVNSLQPDGFLWNDCPISGSEEYYGHPVWFINMQLYNDDYDFWDTKGIVILDEDGTVLEAVLELMSNG